jgi:KDO2-lipid IV(A) lauroyltransferase
VTARERRFEAPHKRLGSGPRLREKLVVQAYRTAAAALGRAPARPAALLVGLAAQLSYLAWPAKRRWSNANFGHVLGLPPTHPRVRRLALAAYRTYGRYLVEVMRLPLMDHEAAITVVPPHELDPIELIWHESRGGLIYTVGHLGNIDAIAAAVGGRGWPFHVVADDSAYQELFDDFRRVRESWGARIVPWRNLREIYAVLRRREMLALLVDWGYRPDGIPVRLFDAWTTLPSGPATLAAKTGSRILPVSVRREDDGTFEVTWSRPIEVTSSEPAELARATQAIADGLADAIRRAPEQWYSFKPIWPETLEEQAELQARAEAMLAGGDTTVAAPGVTTAGLAPTAQTAMPPRTAVASDAP